MCKLEGFEVRVPESVYYMLNQLDSLNLVITDNCIQVHGSIELVNPTIICDEQVDDRLYRGLNEA
ncbi:MAG TPA: hypothetical protein VEG39_14305 [Clostridia bacterium]|nr:hypothetical protein [Clostridia bacterium]